MYPWATFLFTNRTNLPAAKYNKHREKEGWKLDKNRFSFVNIDQSLAESERQSGGYLS